MIGVQALYFNALLAQVLYDAGYRSLYADSDVWMRPGIKPYGFQYQELVLCYVDDVISVSHDPMRTMQQVQANSNLKIIHIKEPGNYLVADLRKF